MPVYKPKPRDSGEASKWGNLLDVNLMILTLESTLWAVQNWY